ncbi:MAG: hypothetical protein LBJ00_09955 [Planctomycetaceae bacterium]|nr:hypothetical protein [Planctomycetaceae bacterium]
MKRLFKGEAYRQYRFRYIRFRYIRLLIRRRKEKTSPQQANTGRILIAILPMSTTGRKFTS